MDTIHEYYYTTQNYWVHCLCGRTLHPTPYQQHSCSNTMNHVHSIILALVHIIVHWQAVLVKKLACS